MNKILYILLISQILFSCGHSNFAKRKYTKGIYIEKHTLAKSTSKKNKKQKVKKEEPLVIVNQSENNVVNKEEMGRVGADNGIIDRSINDDFNGNQIINNEKLLEEVEVEVGTPPSVNDGEELTQSSAGSHSKKAIIFGSLAIGLLILAVSIFLLDYFIVLSGFLIALAYVTGILGAGSMAVLGVIFGALGVKRGGGTKATVGLILAAFTLAVILTLIVLSIIFLI